MIFCDLDGVLADFDAHHFAVVGKESNKFADHADWAKVAAEPMFYATMPLMPDARQLWAFIAPYNPIILTGLPSTIPGAGEQKRAWVATHIDPRTQVITCASAEKSKFCRPGDLLIDDWEKYRHLWVGAGGQWITHYSAPETIRQLKHLGWSNGR